MAQWLTFNPWIKKKKKKMPTEEKPSITIPAACPSSSKPN